MKSLLLAMIASFVTLYALVLGLGWYNTTARYEEMEIMLSQVVRSHLEEGYGKGNDPGREENLISDIRYRMRSNSKIEVIVHEIDYNLGVISVTVRESFVQLNGKEKQLEWKKTAIMDRMMTDIVTDNGYNYKEMYGINE